MDRKRTRIVAGGAGAALICLAACQQEPAQTADPANSSACVDIPDGYYLFTEGQFSPTSADMAIELPAPVTQRSVAWSDDVTADLNEAGFDWLSINVAAGVVTLLGTAPDANAAAEGFEAARTAIRANSVAARDIKLVVDGISVSGGEDGVGAAVATLNERPTPEACQATFSNVMQGRNVEFDSGNSSISPSSARLLDAVTGTALICEAYTIEIGGHTDARGAESFNQRLSQERADAVKAYLVERSVSEDRLRAVGYGETRPIDASQTTEAYARNRRTEFNVLSD
ncbi:MAG: OmpA family protein [Henriciella sp.]|uniref:OmpA family protein n=1 Tax=Henriciella sp. TaxID=1968823 RepID=UPI003C71F586